MADHLNTWDSARETVALCADAVRREILLGEQASFEKSANDWVSSLDTMVDTLARELLASSTTPFLSEEDEKHLTDSLPDRYWILDPVDGTRNAIMGIPYFAISLAYVADREVRVAVTCNPVTRETYHACKGNGFWRDQEKLAAPTASWLVTSPGSALVSTGFPHDKSLRAKHLKVVEWIVTHCSDLRRFASPTLDICQLASGRIHGMTEMLRPWDYAAGSLFLDEQGIRHNIRFPLKAAHFSPTFYFAAGSPAVYPQLMSLLDALELEH